MTEIVETTSTCLTEINGTCENDLQVDLATPPITTTTFNGAGALDPQAADNPFPIDCLPGPAAEMVREVCRVMRVPESLPGCCALGILSAAVGKGLRVTSGPNRTTPGNLFVLAGAKSGTGKSETFRHIAQAFQDCEHEHRESWRTGSLPALRAEKATLESEIAMAKKRNPNGLAEREEMRKELEDKMAALETTESSLHPPVLSAEDVTTEKLALLLSENGECLASLSSDAGSAVNNLLGRYTKGNRTDETIYLKAFSGDSHVAHRIGREPVRLNSPCLSVLWLVQPDKIESLLANPSLVDGGLMPRLLMCQTNCRVQKIVDGILPIPPNVIAAFGKLIRYMLKNYRLTTNPITIIPTRAASQAMTDYYNQIAPRLETDLRDVSTFAARWAEQAWRISVVLHAALWPSDAGAHELELETAQRAIALADWFAQQQLEILAAGREAANQVLLKNVLSLIQNNPGVITARDVQRKRITPNAEEAHQLLEGLAREGHLVGRDAKPQGGGHVTRVYNIAGT